MEIKNFNFIVPIIVFLIFVGALIIYLLGIEMIKKGENKEDGIKILIKALEKNANRTIYYIKYEENISESIIETSYLSGEKVKGVQKENEFFKEEYYLVNGSEIFCLSYEDKRECSNINNSTEIKKTFTNYFMNFPHNLAKNALHELKVLINKNAINITGFKKIESDNCTLIEFIRDFDKLSLEDLREIGKRPDDPILFLSKDMKIRHCIDANYNFVYSEVEYIIKGKKYRTTTRYKELNIDENVNLKINELDTNLEKKLESLKLIQSEINKCGDDSICIKTLAHNMRNPYICLLAKSEKDRCIVMLAPLTNKEELCKKIESKDLKDDCYFEIGAKNKKAESCNNIESKEKRESCLSIAKTAEEKNKSNGDIKIKEECEKDSDCVRAGCSGQMCVSKERAQDIITTCEWREEYEQLKNAKCGCINKTCTFIFE